MPSKHFLIKYGTQSLDNAQDVVNKINELVNEYEKHYQQLMEQYHQEDYPAHYFLEELRYKSPIFFIDGPLGCGKSYVTQELLKTICHQEGIIRKDNIIYIDCLNFATSKSNYESILTNILFQVYKFSKKRWYWSVMEWFKNFLDFTKFTRVHLTHQVERKNDPNILYYQSNYIPTNWSKLIQSQMNAVSISKNSNLAFVKVNLSSGKGNKNLKAQHTSSYYMTKTLIDVNELTYQYDESLQKRRRTLIVLENIERLAIHTWEIPRILQLLSSFDNFLILAVGDIETMNKLYCNINVNHIEKFNHFLPFQVSCSWVDIYLEVINSFIPLNEETYESLRLKLNKSYVEIKQHFPQQWQTFNNARVFKKMMQEEVKQLISEVDNINDDVTKLLQPWKSFMQANGMLVKNKKD